MSNFDAHTHLGISINPDGTVTRLFNSPTTAANPEPLPGTPTVSKDVTIDANKQTWVRILRPVKLPSNDNTVARLPILIYFHSGGFVFQNPDDFATNRKCVQIAADIPSIVVSVGFRRAPEHRLPTQYHDARDAVLWINSQLTDPNGEKWLKDYGDFSRSYLYGCGCGANIAFNAAIKLADDNLEPLRICGVVMNQPMFGGEKRAGSELKYATDQTLPLPVLDLMWRLALPEETDRDHRYCNPMVKGPHQDGVKKLGRVLVIGYGGDIMVDRQQEFVTMLAKCGVQVEARFDQVGFHNIDMVDPARAAAAVNIVKDFILG
uniref:Gibberellin receptor GID1L2 n=2 Tax=Cajanus cajan TaxID=3821 RepID=A0A151UCE4_CAJCA|nr:putative gibberellin receptor GID1L2 [Cajanus cajan]